MTAVAPPGTARSSRTRLAALLAASYGLRVWLAISGGQAFWPDESRYGISQQAAYELAHRHWRLALEALLGGAGHVFFRWVGLPVACVEYAVGGYHPALAACYFGLFSVGAIYLVWAVAKRAGGGESEALWAAFFAAASNSLFYYSRHYLPYDAALFAMLVALWLALGPWSPATALLAGIVAGFGFLTYNGYWLLGACVLVLYAAIGAGGTRLLAARACLAFAGLVLPIALFLAMGAAVSSSVLHSYLEFAGSVKQGDFHVGFRVVPEYLWRSEGPLLVVLLAAFGCSLVPARGGLDRRRIWWWGASVAFLYLGLVFFSDVVPALMVYGRLSRCLVPFLCLGAGAGAARFLAGRGKSRRAWSAAALLLVLLLAAANLAVPLGQVFPVQFQQILERQASRLPAGKYYFLRAVNTGTLWGRPLQGVARRPGEEQLLRWPNPLQFRPYQFEGFTQAQRLLLNSNDLAMQVFGLPMRPGLSGTWDGYPGPVRMTVRFPRDRSSFTEPLLSSGRTGSGDTVFVRYVDAGHVALGADHWGSPAVVSGPVPVDLDRPHELVISWGSLLPPPGSPIYGREPGLELMRGHLLVELDGRVVLSRHAESFAPRKESIHFGVNLIGASSSELYFTGLAEDFGPAPFDEVARSVPVLAAAQIARDRSSEWSGAVGPVRMRFSLPPRAPGPDEGQPFLSIVGPRVRQVLLVVRSGEKVLIGLDNMGTGGTWSPPMDPSPSGEYEVDLCVGALLPASGAPLYGRAPTFVAMRKMIYVSLNHRLALFAEMPAAQDAECRAVFGANVPGSSACAPFFGGEITSIKAIELEDIPAGRLAASDLAARLARPGWDGYTGPLRFSIAFGAGRQGEGQPILSTGVTGRGDIVFVRYDAGGMARICVDHWGAPLMASDSFDLVPGATHDLTLSLGSLFPPGAVPLPEGDEGFGSLRSRIRVCLDGRRILDRGEASYPTLPEWVTIGSNFLGGSTTGPVFLGEIKKVAPADLAAVQR
jgi:hypothetical protein